MEIATVAIEPDINCRGGVFNRGQGRDNLCASVVNLSSMSQNGDLSNIEIDPPKELLNQI